VIGLHFATTELHIGPAGAATRRQPTFWNIASNYIRSDGALPEPTLESGNLPKFTTIVRSRSG